MADDDKSVHVSETQDVPSTYTQSNRTAQPNKVLIPTARTIYGILPNAVSSYLKGNSNGN